MAFNLVWKINWFWIGTLHDLVEKLTSVLYAIESKSKSNYNSLAQLQVFRGILSGLGNYLSFDWFTGLPVFFMIGLE